MQLLFYFILFYFFWVGGKALALPVLEILKEAAEDWYYC